MPPDDEDASDASDTAPVTGVRSERTRVATCTLVGIVVAVPVGGAGGWELGVLAGWIATAGLLTGSIWFDLHRLDAARTAAVATREDDSRTAARLLLLGASVASLLAVVAGLRRATQVGIGLEVALTAGSLASVVSAWTVVHTVYVLRYAHLYYGGADVGGIEFPGDAAPTYRDFAYVGFTVGMTFQVSDTAITSPVIRATVLRHALLSYLLGTSVIAATINVLAGLIGR